MLYCRRIDIDTSNALLKSTGTISRPFSGTPFEALSDDGGDRPRRCRTRRSSCTAARARRTCTWSASGPSSRSRTPWWASCPRDASAPSPCSGPRRRSADTARARCATARARTASGSTRSANRRRSVGRYRGPIRYLLQKRNTVFASNHLISSEQFRLKSST